MVKPKSAAAPKTTNVLDLKRLTAIGIRMSRLKVPWQVCIVRRRLQGCTRL